MGSLRSRRKSVSSLFPPRFHFLRKFKYNTEFTSVFILDNDDTPGTFPKAQKSLVQIITACLEALDWFSKIQPIKVELGPKIHVLVEKRCAFNQFLKGIPIVALTTCDEVDDNDQLVLVSLILQMSVILVQLVCLLHPRWLNLDKKQVQRDYDWAMKSTNCLLGIAIPWEEMVYEAPENHKIGLTADQRAKCTELITRGRFGELQKLMVVIEDNAKWEDFTWSKRQASPLTLGFEKVTLLLEKIMVFLNRPRWAGYMLPLPSKLASEEQSIEDVTSRADFHTKWANPKIMDHIYHWIGGLLGSFDLGSADPRSRSHWENTGLWFIHSAEYQTWYNSSKGTNERFLWCLGDIGMGKSVLMHVVFWQLRELSKRLPFHMRPICVQIHIHFETPCSATIVWQSILRQILTQIKVPTDLVVSIYHEILNHTAKYPEEDQIVALLRDLATAWNIYFFIDGLDECKPLVAKEIATELLSLGPNHRVIFFSRPFSLIHHEAFSDLTFWKIEANRTDMEVYFDHVLDFHEGGWQRRQITVSPEDKLLALDLVEKNSKRSFLLLEKQARLIMSEQVRRPLMEYVEEIPESVFERYADTIYRLRFYLTPDDPIFNTIAWTCVNGSLSITEDVPHIVPRLPQSALESLNSHVDSSLGLLNIVDGSIQFATKLAQMFVLTKFETTFPTFISEVRPMLAGFPEGTREWHLKESLELFINTRENLHHNSDGRLGHTAKTDQVSPVSPV